MSTKHLGGILLLTFLAIVAVGSTCELDEMREGCRIQNGQCLCGIGCDTEYRYSSKEDCKQALKGRKNDVCRRSPCLNGGSCIQTSREPGYKCKCYGTGFHGSRCQVACPTNTSPNDLTEDFPFECVII